MWAAADPDQGLADDVVDREEPGVDRVAAEDGAERQASRGPGPRLDSSSEAAISSAPRRAVISETGLAKRV